MIRDVWAWNLEQEMKIISDLVVDYPYIAMDTEFPGVVAKPAGSFKSTEALEYQAMRCNVDILKIIQIGITLGDSQGNVPSPCCTWQFNFKFDLNSDPHFYRAIVLLQSSGIKFERFQKEGIDVYDFARLLIPSGLVLCDKVTWVTFHSISDFGYLLKVLTCSPLPDDHQEFFNLLHIYFPHFYDIKYYTSVYNNIANGLQGIADQLNVERVGKEHQAGSDALVTLKVFFELQRQILEKDITEMDAENKLYGVSPPPLLH
ncbi:Poly(A) ribonuclease pop2 [Tritrichomonas foetus]|uniref:poly(A)-specific ribonuclease n=1 Tax=Tritrichomonas foetus TaxID=1144522 RepID=A0A1J4JH94_9EUKA|nr:Poly(A) ribonuclease pop2 [Tritrichomonas foetus]|eukprot:OHS97631.1 Poly(A) ribonuclease pop2 [Tritrichomonas foetus]